VAANMGVVPPKPGYLEALRTLCDENGTLLIFDEVISGFRVAFGGAQERYGVQADLTCLGKIVGGGLPLAVCGGRARIMNLLAPLGHVYQAGTLSGNPLATAAANATLEVLETGGTVGNGTDSTYATHGTYAQLEATAADLEAGLVRAAAEAGVPITINRVGSLMSVFFTAGSVRNFDDVRATDIAAFKRFFAEMLHRGVYLAPSAYEAMFISLAHTEQDIERTVAAAHESFRRVLR
jgi:glutamate-1-semialdehyde 2,1-aminomutase